MKLILGLIVILFAGVGQALECQSAFETEDQPTGQFTSASVLASFRVTGPTFFEMMPQIGESPIEHRTRRQRERERRVRVAIQEINSLLRAKGYRETSMQGAESSDTWSMHLTKDEFNLIWMALKEGTLTDFTPVDLVAFSGTLPIDGTTPATQPSH